MMPRIPDPVKILIEVCDRLGYAYTMIDTYSNNLVEVTSGDKAFVGSNGRVGLYPINMHTASELVADKAWCNVLLRTKGYRVPEGDYFFLKQSLQELRGDGKEYNDALLYAKKLGYPVFVKPNKGSLGINAEIIFSERGLKKILRSIEELSYIALIQEVISLPEYRIFVVDGEVQFLYRKAVPHIAGDGIHTFQELIDQKNASIERQKLKITVSSEFVQKTMQQFNIQLETVLPENMTVTIAPHNNIASGGQILGYSEEASPEVATWIYQLYRDLQLRVFGLDVFVDGSIDDPANFTIIEVNQSPGLAGIYKMGHKEKVFTIWRSILEKYFNE